MKQAKNNKNCKKIYTYAIFRGAYLPPHPHTRTSRRHCEKKHMVDNSKNSYIQYLF